MKQDNSSLLVSPGPGADSTDGWKFKMETWFSWALHPQHKWEGIAALDAEYRRYAHSAMRLR